MKINVGCGPYKMGNYINIDKNPVWQPDLVHDIRTGLPFPDNSINEIFTSHFLEHLDRDEIINFLAECYRTLSKEGTLELIFPIGITYELDHKTFLADYSLDPITRTGNDEYYYGPHIAFDLIKQSKSKDQRYEILQVKYKVRK